ncbi:hypothetical protein IQ229_15370 [Nostoc cf. edaphicum LEGE 07299]|uniref:Uncharacterized protein n=1 Tax=Nostoc cf. edaphicum LEGE 07299 TaxID=2777974 RepID=A0ABR9U2F2_9NOSO|nr:hypothetical protein [Nostoc edaphicum]MBE9106262.1 hypothetical protein [Nostoc cf. edaphicum LEGE 07299]
MNSFIRFLFRFLPDSFIEEVNAASLDELDNRGLIIWADDVDSGAVIWAEEMDKDNNELLN